MKNLLIYSFFIAIGLGQIVSKSHSRSLQKQLDLILGSHLFHKTYSEDDLSIAFSSHFTYLSLNKDEIWNNEEIHSITIRSFQAFIDLPYDLQAHFQLAIPNDDFKGVSTKIFGYGAKYKVPAKWLKIKQFPSIHIQYAYNEVELNGSVSSASDIFSVYANKSITYFDLYASMALHHNKTIFKDQFINYENKQNEVLYKLGLKINYSVLNLTAETTFHNYKNITAGLTINF
jgi:hypothetical protein